MNFEPKTLLVIGVAVFIVAIVTVLLIKRKKDKKDDKKNEPKPIPSAPIELTPELGDALENGTGWLDPNLTKK